MRRLIPIHVTLFAAVALAGRVSSAEETFEGWNLEPGVAQAHLVMVARVASISRLTVVEGAKTDVALREYRFQPVRRLKGLFQRDQLSMTAADLGCPAEDASSAPPLKEGEFRLLILAQQQGRPLGCVAATPGATTFEERVPLVAGPDDPLVAVVETLIQIGDARSRRERAALLVDGLAGARGLSAVPLLSSLRLRADWAAADRRAFDALARLARDPLPAVRGGALEVLRDVLASRIAPDDPRQLDGVAEALRGLLESREPVTRMRLAALEALGHLVALRPDIRWAPNLLIAQLTVAATHAERAAAAGALARINQPEAVRAVLDALANLPLDEVPARESIYAAAAVGLDVAGAEGILLTRLERSIAARESLESEIEILGRMRTKGSLPHLLAAAGQPHLAPRDRQRIAWALGRLGDDRAVPVLAQWLRGTDYRHKEFALVSLEILDSQAAAREARPLLKSEAHLPYKLRLARLVARHGLADGYALATEHLADAAQTAEAALTLAALDDPRTSKDLSAILAAKPDRRWQAAALTGLAALGDAGARKQLFEILGDDRHPLAADAAEAAGLAGDRELLPPLARLARSRNKQIALASLLALRRFLSGVRSSPRGLAAVDPAMDPDDRELGDGGPGEVQAPAADVPPETRAAIAEAVTALVLDAYVEPDVRLAALAVARLLEARRYAELLSELADQAELEWTPLLVRVQAERRRLGGSIPARRAAGARERAESRTAVESIAPVSGESKPISESDAAEIESLRQNLRLTPSVSVYGPLDMIGALALHRRWKEVLPLGKEQAAAITKLDDLVQQARDRSFAADAVYPAADLPSYQEYLARGEARRMAAFRHAQRAVALGLLTEPQAAFVMQRVLATWQPSYALAEPNVQELLEMTKEQKEQLSRIWGPTNPEAFKGPDVAAMKILTKHQLAKWSQLTATRTLPGEPPNLPAWTDADAAQLNIDALAPTLRRMSKLADALQLSPEQKQQLRDLEEVTWEGLLWIGLRNPDDPNLPAEVRKARAERVAELRAEFVSHMEEFARLGILTQDQAQRLLLLC